MSNDLIRQQLTDLAPLITALPAPLVIDFEAAASESGEERNKVYTRIHPGPAHDSLTPTQRRAFQNFTAYLEPTVGTITFNPDGSIELRYEEEQHRSRTNTQILTLDWQTTSISMGTWEYFDD